MIPFGYKIVFDMIKKDIIKSISSNTGVNEEKTSVVIHAFCKTVVDALTKENRVDIRGFGSFFLKKRKAKVGRNINTNTALFLQEKMIPVFKPSKNFIDIIEENFKSIDE